MCITAYIPGTAYTTHCIHTLHPYSASGTLHSADGEVNAQEIAHPNEDVLAADTWNRR
jgi:hypothetical protein